MNSTKQILVTLVCLLICALPVIAQEPQRAPVSRETISRDSKEVTIIIQQQQLRFAAPASAQELRLEVFNQAGETVYDSGQVSGAELSWALHNTSGEAVASGLYAYTLTFKEANSETPALRRGHLILESGRDRLWVTNRGAIGAEASLSGGDLTVSSGAETNVAGAQIGRSIASKGSGTNNINGFGTTGKIPKFGGGDFLINSVITEDFDGRIGIGTQAPGSVLTVAGQIETTSGGIKFPNGTVQTSSAAGALFQVTRNATLTGNGTEISPLGVNIPALGLLSAVSHNGTLVGNGTSASSLGVAVPLGLSGSSSFSILGIVNNGIGEGIIGLSTNPSGVGVYARNSSGGRAIYSEGNAGQSRDKGGWVKALLFVNQDGTIARCYNGVTGSATGNCGFTVSHPASSFYDINFGFQIDDRFITTSPFNNIGSGGCIGGEASPELTTGNTVRVRTSCQFFVDKPFSIIIF